MKVMSESVFNSIIEFIDEYYFANNTVPTMQEIADAINLNKSNVSRNLQANERAWFDRNNGRVAWYQNEKNVKGISRYRESSDSR